MAVYWFDPCLGGGFNGTDDVCHGTTGTAKTGTYSNPFGLDEVFNTSTSNPLGLEIGDEIRIKGEQDSFWWSSSTWNVRGTASSLNTVIGQTDNYRYLFNGNGVTMPTDAFTHAGGTARTVNLFMVSNTSDFDCGWDNRFMFVAGKYSTTGLASTRRDPNGAAIAYLAAASNQYKKVGNASSGQTTASTNPEVQLKWCVKTPERTTSSSARYFLGLYTSSVTSGGASVAGRKVAGGITVTDGWSSETAQSSGYYSLIFNPAHHNSSAYRASYFQPGPMDMRNSYLVGFNTSFQYYNYPLTGCLYYFREAEKPTNDSSVSGSNVFTSTIYLPNLMCTRLYNQLNLNNNSSIAKYTDIRFGTTCFYEIYNQNRYMGYAISSYTQHGGITTQQIHYERVLFGGGSSITFYFDYGQTPNNSAYIADAASASGVSGYHFGDIIALPYANSNAMFTIAASNPHVTLRLKNNSTYCSDQAAMIAGGTSADPLNFHAGTGLTNAATNPDFAEWPYANELSVPGPVARSQSIPATNCPRNVIDASATNFYELVQLQIPQADTGTQTYTAGRINFVNADAGLFNEALLAHSHYFSNANYHTQLVFKECNLTENSGGPVVYGTSHDVDAGSARGSFAYTNSDNELVIIPNRDSSKIKSHSLFYIPVTVPDLSSASTMTTTVEWYLSNWYALSGSTETIIQIKFPLTISATGTIAYTTQGWPRGGSYAEYPTQSSPITASLARTVGSGVIEPVATGVINPNAMYVAVGMYLADNTSLAANSRVIIKSVTITAS